MNRKLFFLLFLALAWCCKDGKAQARVAVNFNQSPLVSTYNPASPQCFLDQRTAVMSYTKGPFLAWVSWTPFAQCQIQFAPPAPTPQVILPPVYTTSELFPLTQQANNDVWCLASPPQPPYPPRLILPAAVIEQRVYAGITQPPLTTLMSPAPQPGSNPWATYVQTYPLWSPQNTTCNGNPSVTFSPTSLSSTSETRTSAQALIVF